MENYQETYTLEDLNKECQKPECTKHATSYGYDIQNSDEQLIYKFERISKGVFELFEEEEYEELDLED